MPLSTIRAAMKTRIETVSNVGVVNDFEPLATREEDFRTFYKHASLDYVLGWSITREATTAEAEAQAVDRDTHLMIVRGYRGLGDAGSTEKAFQDLVEAVRTVLRPTSWSQVSDRIKILTPPAVRIFEPRMFGQYLVHYCELVQQVEELVDVGAG